MIVAGLVAACTIPFLARERPSNEAAGFDGPTAGERIERGFASYYGRAFAGRKTASGELFDPSQMTMAHRTLPFGTRVRVTNLENGRSVDVIVNDRGPFVAGRIVDLSTAAAKKLDMIADGVVEAEVVVLGAGAAIAVVERAGS